MMSTVYFIGDTHFGHNKISEKFRPQFSSDEEHNQVIHENILSVAGKNNQLWLLGDIFFKQSEFWRLGEYAKAFQTVNITLGNHCHSQTFIEARKYKNVKIHGIVKKYGHWISHAPIHECELYRANSIHGHCHDKVVDNPNYVCVSCEQVNYTPISLEEVNQRFEQRRQEYES